MLRFRDLLICLLLFVAHDQVSAQKVGQLNPLFGHTGGAVVMPAEEQEQKSVLLEAIRSGGFYTARSIANQVDRRIEVSRFSSHGVLDVSFGEAGVRKIALEGVIHDIAVAEDSSVYLCGYVQRGRNRDAWMMHILKNGKTDPNFGINGVVTLTIQEQDVAQQIALLDDGAILVGGTTYSPSLLDRDIFLLKLNGKGRLAQEFGTRGSMLIDHSKDDRLKAMALRSDGRIILAGNVKLSQFSRYCVMRVLPQGKFDQAFGNEGTIVLPIGIDHSYLEDMVLLDDGRIIVGGNARIHADDPGFDLAMVRLLPEGQWDPTFGDNGVALQDLGGADYFGGMVIQEDQQVLVAGISGKDAHIFRMCKNGTRDRTYGQSGRSILSRESRVHSLGVALDEGENLLVSLSDNTASQIVSLFGNPDLPGLDQLLAFNWKAGEQEDLTYSGLQLADDIQVDAWLGGSLLQAIELPLSSGPESVQPIEKHIRFFAHLALDEAHRYTFVWDSEGQAHWYLNGSFQNSWDTILGQN